LDKGPKYGFNDQFSGFFAGLQEDISDIITISNPGV